VSPPSPLTTTPKLTKNTCTRSYLPPSFKQSSFFFPGWLRDSRNNDFRFQRPHLHFPAIRSLHPPLVGSTTPPTRPPLEVFTTYPVIICSSLEILILTRTSHPCLPPPVTISRIMPRLTRSSRLKRVVTPVYIHRLARNSAACAWKPCFANKDHQCRPDGPPSEPHACQLQKLVLPTHPLPPSSKARTTTTCPPHANATVVNHTDDHDASTTYRCYHRQQHRRPRHVQTLYSKRPLSTIVPPLHSSGLETVLSTPASQPKPRGRGTCQGRG